MPFGGDTRFDGITHGAHWCWFVVKNISCKSRNEKRINYICSLI